MKIRFYTYSFTKLIILKKNSKIFKFSNFQNFKILKFQNFKILNFQIFDVQLVQLCYTDPTNYTGITSYTEFC